MIDWDTILEGVTWFHFSAIAASLSLSAAEVCEEALQAAQRKNITVSLDLNYRNKLWQYGKQPHEIMPKLVQYCDLVMGNVWAANTMLGISLNDRLIAQNAKDAYLEQAILTSEEIQKNWARVKVVANTFRFDKEGGIQYYTTLFKQQLFVSAEYSADHVTDKVGSGDCFMAGLIYGSCNNYSPQEILDFATAAAFNKLFIKGDTTDQTVETIRATIKKHG